MAHKRTWGILASDLSLGGSLLEMRLSCIMRCFSFILPDIFLYSLGLLGFLMPECWSAFSRGLKVCYLFGKEKDLCCTEDEDVWQEAVYFTHLSSWIRSSILKFKPFFCVFKIQDLLWTGSSLHAPKLLWFVLPYFIWIKSRRSLKNVSLRPVLWFVFHLFFE